MKNNQLFIWALTSALAGFLFGFDTVVISGAEKTIQDLWDLNGSQHGLALSAALWGTVLGSIFGGWPANRFGRKGTLLWIGILYFISAIWSALSNDLIPFVMARFIGGIGVGISTVVGPMYISEIAPAEKRGRLTGMFQFNIVFGILVAFLSNWLIGRAMGEVAWRWMLGVEAIPAVIYALMCLRIPESPRWLITQKGDRAEGKRVLGLSRPEASEKELEALVVEIESHSGAEPKSGKIPFRRLKIPLMLAFLIAFFNQLSGINVILYFAPRLLGLAGIENPLAAAIWLGVVNLIFTFVGLYLIDRLGRKSLLFIGSIGYIASLGICAWAFLSFPGFKVVSSAIDYQSAAEKVDKLEVTKRSLSHTEKPAAAQSLKEKGAALVAATNLPDYKGDKVVVGDHASTVDAVQTAQKAKADASKVLGGMSTLVLVCLLGFIASHAMGQGAVIWVFIAEIFPNAFRAAGQSFGCATHWVFAALLSLLFPIAITKFDAGYIFGFFAFMMVLQLLWVLVMVPETKGVPLEEMEKKLGIS
ncbi:MAG: sugar porter family MFS transporter [Roseibacillus sp.]